MIGRKLAHYEVVDKIGEGGMGEVYRARDLKLGREVALKVLPGELAHDPDRRKRFEREARAVAALKHPNIVTLHAIEEADGLTFITMELVEGRMLSSLIGEKGLPLGNGGNETLRAAARQGGGVPRVAKPRGPAQCLHLDDLSFPGSARSR